MHRLEVDNKTFTIQELYSMYKRGELTTDIVIQRGIKWSIVKRSLYIHSILLGIIAVQPPFVLSRTIVTREDNTSKSVYKVVDGKQRLTTLFSFIEGGFTLKGLETECAVSGTQYVEGEPSLAEVQNNEMYAVEGAELRYDSSSHIVENIIPGAVLNGKAFGDLAFFMDVIRDTPIQCTVALNPTEEQDALIFDRLNSGDKVSVIDRARANCKATAAVRSLAESEREFFNLMFTKEQLLKKPEDEIIIKTAMMLDFFSRDALDKLSLTSSSYMQFAKSLNADYDLSRVRYVFERAVAICEEIPEDLRILSIFIKKKAMFLALAPYIREEYTNEQIISCIRTIIDKHWDTFMSSGAHSPNSAAIVARDKIIKAILE